MYWELQNVVATLIATSAMVSPAPGGDLKYSGADAFERWHLVASASRKPWDASEAPRLPRFAALGLAAGESTRATLAFDWQRTLNASRLEAAAYAHRIAIDEDAESARLEGSSYGERFQQRDRRSTLGAALRWSADGMIGAFPAAHAVSMRLRNETVDADGAFRAPGGEATSALREDRLRQSGAALDFQNEIQLAPRLRSLAAVRYDAYRFGVGSDLAGHEGSLAGSLASPRVSLIADLAPGSELFVSMASGYGSDDVRGPGAAIDPRNAAPIGRLDPLSTVTTREAGVRYRILPGLEAAFSFFRARSASELMLTGDTGIDEIARPVVRRGVQASVRYRPASWATVDLHVSALRARFDDGLGERVAGAAGRTISAATTVRTPSGWTASLLVNSLGARDASDDAIRVKPSTFVNARLSRNLSKRTRLSLDVFNIFDRRTGDVDYFSAARLWSNPGAADSFLASPTEPRGFRVKLRTTF